MRNVRCKYKNVCSSVVRIIKEEMLSCLHSRAICVASDLFLRLHQVCLNYSKNNCKNFTRWAYFLAIKLSNLLHPLMMYIFLNCYIVYGTSGHLFSMLYMKEMFSYIRFLLFLYFSGLINTIKFHFYRYNLIMIL